MIQRNIRTDIWQIVATKEQKRLSQNTVSEFRCLVRCLVGVIYTHWSTIGQKDAKAQIPAVEFDMAMEDLRAKRNNLLKDTDHYALSDQTLSDDMRTYRQDLRDLTNGLTTVEQVEAVIWPTKPGA